LDKDYWKFLGDPIYDTSSEECADFESLGHPNIVETNSENFHYHFHPYTYTNDVDFGQHEEDIFTYLFQPSRAYLLQLSLLRFGYLGKWSPCVCESLNTKGESLTLMLCCRPNAHLQT
jgi:hypothetical protein